MTTSRKSSTSQEHRQMGGVQWVVSGGTSEVWEAIRQTQNMFRTVFDHAPMGMAIIDTNEHFIESNAYLLSMLGYAESELRSQSWIHLAHEEDRARCAEAFQHLLDGDTSHVTLEMRYLCKDGSPLWCDVALSAVRDPDGICEYMIGMLRDITERKNAEQRLRHTKADLEALLRSMPDLYFKMDEDGTIVNYHAGKMEDLLLPPERFMGKRMQDVLPPEIGEHFERAMKQSLARRKQVAIEYSLKVAGRDQLFEARISPIENGGLISVIQNITARMRGVQALAESEERFRQLADAAQEGIAVTENGIVVDANDLFPRMWGYEREEVLGKRVPELVAPADHEMVLNHIRSGYEKPYEFRGLRKDGSVFIAEACGKMVRRDGRVARITALRDMTERIAAQQREIEMQKRLARSEKMESLGLLAGGVAHDLNNILAPVVGYPDLLLDDLPADSALRGTVVDVKHAAKRAADLVQHLLMLSRREAYEQQPVDINEVVLSFLRSPTHRDLCERHPDVWLETELDPNLPNVKGSVSHLSQVFMNLVINAFEATPKRGSVQVRTSYEAVDSTSSSDDTITSGRYIILRIRDHGTGMSKESLPRVFEPFFSSKGAGRSGTGLGLAIVYRIVKDLGGFINVCSEPGEGTEFTLYFPRSGSDCARSEVARAPERGTEHILIIDDGEDQGKLPASLLASLGYQVHVVSCEDDALESLDATRYDLVTIEMTEEGDFAGLDVIRRIAAKHPALPCLIISGYGETERIREAKLLGHAQCLGKPFTRSKLGQAVRRLLSERSRAQGDFPG